MITWYTYILHMKSVLEHKLDLSMKLSQLQNSRWEWTYNKDDHVQRSKRRNIRKNKLMNRINQSQGVHNIEHTPNKSQ